MLGDFNLPGVLWDSTISKLNVHLSSLVRLRDFLYLDQMIKDPTREANTLDPLFCNESIIKSIEINETVISDLTLFACSLNLELWIIISPRP